MWTQWIYHLSAPPQSSLAVCSRCGEKITDRVLKAMGQCFHSHCFRCSTCSCSLEGAPFITDDNNNPYCVQDYHRWLLAVDFSMLGKYYISSHFLWEVISLRCNVCFQTYNVGTDFYLPLQEALAVLMCFWGQINFNSVWIYPFFDPIYSTYQDYW